MSQLRTLNRIINSFLRLKNHLNNSNSQTTHSLKSPSSLPSTSSRSGESERCFDRKELSPDMEIFVRHLYKEGYFNYSNLLPNNKLVLSYFQYRYGRDFLKFAAEKFGRDNQEIAKWLSGSDLKKVALFGCPSTARKNVFAAKRLRKFFRIQEDTVCHKCIFKQSCKYVNQSVWNCGTNNLNLAVVMVVITQYALEAVPQQLVIPEDIQASVSRLLKEILKLSPTVSRN